MVQFFRLTFTDFAKLVDSFDWKRRVTSVHIHHAWRPNHAQWQGLASIQGMWRHHTHDCGWSDIAQHVTIDPEGFIWTGRGWNQPPVSAAAFNGSRTHGPFMVEMIGDFGRGRDPFGGAQKETALRVTAYLCEKFQLSTDAVRFHSELSARHCPGPAIDRLTYLAEVNAWRPRVARTDPDAARGEVSFDAEGLATIRRAIVEASVVNEPPEAELKDGPQTPAHALATPQRRSAAARGGLDAATRQMLRRHVVNSRNGRFVPSGDFATTPSDVERIFKEHLPAFARARADGQPLRLAFYAHGGLNDEATGLAIAEHQIPWWLANDVYPIFFVWETGLLESLAQMLSPYSAVPGLRRGLGDLVAEGTDELIEAICHRFGGVGVWSHIKLSAVRGVDAQGSTRYTINALDSFLGSYSERPVELHAIGHSAGSIFHAFFLPKALGVTRSRFQSLSLLAPAIRIDEFKAQLLPKMGKGIAQTTIFTMNRDLERADNCFQIYRKSLLYLIDHALEPEENTPILGLEERLHADRDLHASFGLVGHTSSQGGAVVWSSTAPVTSGPAASTAHSHGGFDDDSSTMNAVLRRVLGLTFEPLKQEFPGPRRERALQPTLQEPAAYLPEPWRSRLVAATAVLPAKPLPLAPTPAVPMPPSASGVPTGRRLALCVGIDSYPSMPLAGCVADARDWASALGRLGFASPRVITESDANRQQILDALGSLIDTSRPGDALVFHYSGHGTQFDDLEGEEDGKDEAIVPIDYETGAYIIDDDFADLFRAIPEGVSLTCFFDCCHSGTNTRLAIGAPFGTTRGDSRRRFLPPTAVRQETHRQFRAGLARGAVARGELDRSRMRQVVFAACQPNESAWETNGSGDFTRLTLPLLSAARRLSHRELERSIVEAFGPNRRQTPMLDCAPSAENAPLFGGPRGEPAALGTTIDGRLEPWVRVAQAIADALRAVQ
nr:caspase family protein [Gammaproteobacteria bacterium]